MISRFNDTMNNTPRIKQQNVIPTATKVNLLAAYNPTTNSIEYKDTTQTIVFSIDLTSGLVTASKLAVSGVVGFNGATPISKPTVTGSRGANAALASLLTALANLGLITNSSS